MNEKKFTIIEALILLAVVGLLASLVIRFFYPERLVGDGQWLDVNNPIHSLLIASVSAALSVTSFNEIRRQDINILEFSSSAMRIIIFGFCSLYFFSDAIYLWAQA